jgi:lysophospholipase L1-like esterase
LTVGRARRAALFGVRAALLVWACAYASCGGQTSEPKPASAVDASVVDVASVDSGPRIMTPIECFIDLAGPVVGPFYEPFAPKMGTHCAGTHAQQIEGVEKLVFLGDSITVGTPPTPTRGYYSTLVENGVKERFGPGVEVRSCAKWGARADDLIRDPDSGDPGQIAQCFPTGVEEKKTLVVMTMGGNDVSAWSDDVKDEESGKKLATEAAQAIGTALEWLKSPAHFPRGSYVVFANVYEYTDASGDMASCPASTFTGNVEVWTLGAPILRHFEEELMRHAVATGSDIVFLLENFCGHGFRRTDPALQCYRGEGAELWFDFTCIHPNPRGHAKIAELFLTVIDGK